MDLNDPNMLYLLLLLLIWTLPWKGVALWMAARRSHTGWFIALLVLNTVAVLDILYIFLVAKRYTVETQEATDAGSKGQSMDAEK